MKQKPNIRFITCENVHWINAWSAEHTQLEYWQSQEGPAGQFLVRRDESPENYCHSPGVVVGGVVVVVVVVVRRQKL